MKVIKSEKLSTDWSPRFVIVDENTGNVLDDAQGYGYTSAQNAHRAWSWKSKSKSEKKRISRRRKAIAKWWDRHPEFELEVEDIMFRAAKHESQGSEPYTKKEIFDACAQVAKEMGITDFSEALMR